MTNVVLHHHLGLGDHFICNGLVHSLLERNNWEELHLVCKPHYSKTVKHLYEDFSNIKLLVVKDEYTEPVEFAKNNNMEMLRIGFEHIDANNFENSFYNQCMVDIDAEYTQFILPSRLDASEEFYNTVTEKLGQDYIFVHKECSIKNYDLKIDSNLPQHIAEKNDTDDILDYVHPLRLISPGSSLPSPFKTWVELKELLIKSKTKAKPTIGPNEVLFFDDMPHPDMFAKLGANFIKLDEYSGRPTNERLKAVFLAALNDSGLLSPAFKELFFTYSAACTHGTKANDVQDFLTRLTTTMMGTIIGGPNVSGPISDTDSGNCTTMIDALTGLIPATKNNNAENLRAIKIPRRTNKNGGFRKRTRRKYKSLYRFY
jgi:hypothetical protein